MPEVLRGQGGCQGRTAGLTQGFTTAGNTLHFAPQTQQKVTQFHME